MTTAEMIPFTAETVAVQRPSFWAIADDMEAYHETLMLLEAQMETCTENEERRSLLDEHTAVMIELGRLSEALVKKTDDLAGVMRRMKHDAASLREEEQRLYGRRKATEAALDSLKGYTRSTMDKHGWKHLKTAQNTIAIRGNGGVPPLVVDDPAKVPDELCTWRGEISNAEMCDFLGYMLKQFQLPFIAKFKRAPSNALIREALCQPCPSCGGHPELISPMLQSDPTTCSGCGGSGRASVPGAHLEERGSHLELR